MEQGRQLPLMEAFYTLQGEGTHTGKAAWFIRLGGCDVGCYWCDVKESWDASLHPLTDTDEIISQVIESGANAVVVTGGEPMQYNLDYLCQQLHISGIKTFLETSGSEKPSGDWDWICLSPKKNACVHPDFFLLANELKMIIHDDEDFLWAEENGRKVNTDCRLLLQPEWSQYKIIMAKIVDYILRNPKWTVSLQAHKFMKIP